MGLFKKLKKAFKKVTGFVKKIVKKTVKAVKKVGKKIASSKILKALAIAAAVVVTGGAALTAFGGTGALASSQFGSWMMATSQSVLGGTAFGSAAAMKPGVGKFLTQTGNFLAKTAAKPFGAVGGALGSTARVGANILTGAEGGAFAPGQAAAAPAPFSSSALTGQRDMSNLTDAELKIEYNLTDEELDYFKEDMFAQEGSVIAKDGDSFAKTVTDPSQAVKYSAPSTEPGFFDTTAGKVTSFVGRNVGGALLQGATAQYIQGDPQQQGSMAGAAYEGESNLGALLITQAEKVGNVSDIYNRITYGNADPGTQYSNNLYKQATFGATD
jgi:hypothetical protein